MIQLDQTRGSVCTVRRAATMPISDSLIRPSFEDPNVADRFQLAAALNELANSAGLLRQKRWSVSLPEAAGRTLILTLETQPGSSSELEEVLTWKIERSFGVSFEELAITREKLPADSQGRDRYIVIAIRRSVLDDYENLFAASGWRCGLILPRHMGEARWLTRNGFKGDSLLLSSSNSGFTAVVFRGKQPLILRSVTCEAEEREDELYRLLLFYRERRVGAGEQSDQTLSRLLVIGEGLTKDRASEIVNETLGTHLRVLDATNLGLQLPGRELSFDSIAAPAGLATLAWP